MIIQPELRALRGDDTPQCDAQDELQRLLDAWRAAPYVAALHREIEVFAAGADISDCPRLEALFLPDTGAARRLTDEFSATLCAALAALPLGHVPLRHFTDGVTSTVLIARAGGVTLSLVALDGEGMRSRPESTSASFGPTQTWEHVLGGSARIEQVECQPTGPRSATFRRGEREICPGSILYRDGLREARLLRRIDGALVSLRLQRRRANAEVTREYDLASGEMLHQAAGNPRDSRVELMLAMLGRMGRKDAAPLMAQIARDEGSTALRWQALRECLALDTETGFAALAGIATDRSDALSGPAEALRAQLLQVYPQLQEVDACPA